jgi:hypothetical protein
VAGEAGNLALPDVLYAQIGPPDASNYYLGRFAHAASLLGPAYLNLRAPVFVLGEVLVLDGDGREVAGRGRKPDKWDVDCERFDSIDDAIARARSLEPVAS